jgi:hypothetical protein
MTALLTEDEAAKRLHISARLLRDIRSKGRIRYVALSAKRIRYRPEDCDEYIESRVTKVEPHPDPKPKLGRPRRQRSVAEIIPFSQQAKR